MALNTAEKIETVALCFRGVGTTEGTYGTAEAVGDFGDCRVTVDGETFRVRCDNLGWRVLREGRSVEGIGPYLYEAASNALDG